MKLTTYPSADYNEKDILQTVCEGLVLGYDPVLLLNNLKPDSYKALEKFRGFIKHGDNYEHLDIDDNTMSQLVMRTVIPSDYYHENLFLAPFDAYGFTVDQIILIEEGIRKRIDVSTYAKPEYSESLMKTIINILENNRDIKPFLEIIPHFTDGELQIMGKLYAELGDKVMSVVKNNIEFHKQLSSSVLQKVITAQVFELVSAEQLAGLSELEVEDKIVQRMREKVESTIREEAVAKGISIDTNSLSNCDFYCLKDFLSLWSKTQKMLVFYLLRTKNKFLYIEAKRWVEERGVLPPITGKNIKDRRFSTAEMEEQLKKKLFSELFRGSPSMFSSYSAEQLVVLYQAHKRGTDITSFANPNYSAKEMEIIIKYSEKGTDILQYVIPSKELMQKLDPQDKNFSLHAYVSLIDTLGYLLHEHNLNLFPQVMNHIKEHAVFNDKITGSVDYIARVLFFSKYETPEKREKILKTVDKLLQVTVHADKFYPYHTMAELHKGFLEGADISEYADDVVIEKHLDTVREAVVHNVNSLIDYIKGCENCDRYTVKHLYRILAGYVRAIPDIKMYDRLLNHSKDLYGEHPFYRAVQMIETAKQVNRKHYI